MTIERRCGVCSAPAPFKSVTTDAGIVYACERCSNHWYRKYGDNERPEPLSSKNLVGKLRAGSYDAEAEYPGADGIMRMAADEIERLTRERDTAVKIIEAERNELAGTKDELHSVDKAAKELGAERDRLRQERNHYRKEWLERGNENARLRAALEHIIRYEEVDNDGNPMPESGASFIAREALAGGADENEVLREQNLALNDSDNRLRAALERLKRACIESKDYHYAAIATEALAGGADPQGTWSDGGKTWDPVTPNRSVATIPETIPNGSADKTSARQARLERLQAEWSHVNAIVHTLPESDPLGRMSMMGRRIAIEEEIAEIQSPSVNGEGSL